MKRAGVTQAEYRRAIKAPVRDNDKSKIAALKEDVRHLERKRDELWAELASEREQR